MKSTDSIIETWPTEVSDGVTFITGPGGGGVSIDPEGDMIYGNGKRPQLKGREGWYIIG